MSQYPLRWAPSSDEVSWTRGGYLASLNTLSGGHPLRTRDSLTGVVCSNEVSIPSQVGTLFGPGGHARRRRHPVRLNTLSGGHPLRTLTGVVCSNETMSLNTLSGGHPLRTPSQSICRLSTRSVSIPSQVGTLFGHPLTRPFGGNDEVSIPSQVGTLFGRWSLVRACRGHQVSIPSQVGTLFGHDVPGLFL